LVVVSDITGGSLNKGQFAPERLLRDADEAGLHCGLHYKFPKKNLNSILITIQYYVQMMGGGCGCGV
jgi:hypothetical protein